EYNMLRAASVAMTGDYKFYKLAYGDYTNQTDLGFYYGAAGGAAFTAKEGGAYLAIPASIPAPIRYILNATDHSDVVTSIESVETSGDIVKFVSNGQIFIRVNNQIFNAQGQLIK
ncbi:MAG: hypothetical protein MJZ89_06745, partial [Paludibacteraceae bacterium]|nr:hypothetical protein [Paludibacteraceae bacterium]